ncbi:hypothetical protein [Methylobacterium sp. NEAU K]|uniref:hypothetical protein n=1 Tax=Methylobacterium sp. NEAU K TaxID=3064946 RepID=UPI0027344688|nr:hypothetical protein [Methylobacterium sp. NEAU K]MDP4003656.1 hypothetical protein [Methylobacterium sp. NEAU K]
MRFLSVLVALVLIATSVMPLVAEARGESSAAHAHAFHGIDHGDHDDDHGPDGPDPADLAHHAQSHAQTLTPAQPAGVTTTMTGADVRFQAVHDRFPGRGQGRAPFEPPRG